MTVRRFRSISELAGVWLQGSADLISLSLDFEMPPSPCCLSSGVSKGMVPVEVMVALCVDETTG